VEKSTRASRDVLVTGATGYLGSRLVVALVARGHRVRAFARPRSSARVPAGASVALGDALDAASIGGALRPGDCLVHLVGTPHPSPSKANEFKRIDLVSVSAAVDAARRGGVTHFIYVSVAQPAPIMKAYLAVRAEGERRIREAGLTATVLRPWYVLGPGHRWPLILKPFYAAAALVPSLKDGVGRLGLVTRSQMMDALVHAVENPPPRGTVRIVEVPGIRASSLSEHGDRPHSRPV
jgi:uncharacterized protein YbjT (DUF2867 family)